MAEFISDKFCPSIIAAIAGADPEGGAPGVRPPKIGKNVIFFWRKIVIFHTKYPKHFRASLRNWKKYDFLV
jgi:hypothetical protein